MRHTIRRRFGIALALGALSATFIAAQDPKAQPSQQPPFRTETNFVRVDVYPTKNGMPVEGLKLEDFELFEDGVRQEIKAFEHVLISPAGPQANRREPSSQREMMQAAANPRSRVFVIFLDTWNVTVTGSHNIAEPIIRLIDRIIGPDDLVGIMTPAMSVSNVILARKTQVIEDSLRTNWVWGMRHSLQFDNREIAYQGCYPPGAVGDKGLVSELAKKLIARKRERATFEALRDLVVYLHAIREERKAIITVTEGWVRYRPDESLMNLRVYPDGSKEAIPGPEAIGVDRHGKLTTKSDREFDPDALSKRECDTDRMRLAMQDNDQFFRDIMEDANRGNASFYPIDPRGLAVWDSPLGPEPPPPMLVDQANLRNRLESLHDLALATDGLAIVGNNNLDAGLKRIADDLTSYYLLGYYSTNAKLDGKFRRLKVQVKQPGVNVRARRGYRAATAEEVATARTAAEAPSAANSAFTSAMASLSRIRPEARFRINVATQTSDGAAMLWIAGELPSSSTRTDEFALGATADIEVRAGAATNTTQVTLKPGERGFVVPLKLPPTDATEVQVRARLAGEGTTTPFTDAIDVRIGPTAAQPLVFRRGPTTGNRVVPAADFRFNRTERLKLELPVTAATKPGGARILDKAGNGLQIPVTATERTDPATGQKWITIDLTLAALAAGDYAIELTTASGSDTKQVITAIRITR